MVSVGPPAMGRGLLRILARVLGVFATALGATACTPDHTAICERLAECQLLPEDYSKGKCERELAKERELESCRDCVEETTCEDIVEECRDECVLD